ncbi:hypothetical protein SNOG_02645 [Parastagonospora nodorum SN15]|uniref:Uncharacterized protein n=1 Tax=Phaeosphaeria nodorum (strain SN15 / ATCC MYA-4574 / FGSC 10173) TaxID=321614 RepID=Q0V019_PHANO|nr:hypothetical protein SNOG_02645 [Parastagonospora nodorum SN15]EAT89376.1 hypothetical protein SNOG_02645 [Parastagonospora nodorum SN15]
MPESSPMYLCDTFQDEQIRFPTPDRIAGKPPNRFTPIDKLPCNSHTIKPGTSHHGLMTDRCALSPGCVQPQSVTQPWEATFQQRIIRRATTSTSAVNVAVARE